VLGILVNGRPSPQVDGIQRRLVEQLGKLGYVEGQGLVVETRFANDQAERFPDLVAELIRAKADVLLALGGLSAAAAAKVTKTTPIVYLIVTDPVALGIAASYERPGGNLTGVTTLDPQQPGKQVALLKEVLPRIERLAILSDPTLPGADERGWALWIARWSKPRGHRDSRRKSSKSEVPIPIWKALSLPWSRSEPRRS
jgi:putative ABC transport system substrate-binding protein